MLVAITNPKKYRVAFDIMYQTAPIPNEGRKAWCSMGI